MLFERWVRQFAKDGVERLADLRRMALNGSEQNRRLLIRLEDLDARTLAVLAKQGPTDVRVQVARHPNLSEELARSLLQQPQIKDTAFKEILRHRIASWEAGDEPLGEATTSESPTPDAPDDVPEPPPSITADSPDPTVVDCTNPPNGTSTDPGPSSGLSARPAVPEAAINADVPLVPDGTAILPWIEPVAPISSLDADVPDQPESDSSAGVRRYFDTESAEAGANSSDERLSSDHHSVASPTSLDGAQLDLLALLTFADDDDESNVAAGLPSAPDLDEHVESVLYEIFDRYVDGISPSHALDTLRDKIAAKRPGGLIRSLRKFIAEGADPEAIVLAYAARKYWKDTRVDNGKRYTYLDWPTALCLIESFDSYPDLDEAIQILEKLDHRWRATGCSYSLSLFLIGSMDSLKSYRASGGTLPPDLFFA